jgi:hypothetical protein
MATLVPLAFKAHAFAEWHDFKNVIDGAVEDRVFEKQVGMIILTDFRDGIFDSFFYDWTLPIVFGTLGESNPPPVGQETTQDCSDKYKNRGLDELHKSLLFLVGLLLGGIVGDYFGRLHGLRYRSNSAISGKLSVISPSIGGRIFRLSGY